MPVQNLRAFRATGESYDGGPGNVRTVLWPTGGAIPSAQTFSPNISAVACTVNDPSPLARTLLVSTSATPQVGELLIKNQNPYWVTLTFTTNSATGAFPYTQASVVPQSVAIPPNGIFFIPDNWSLLTGLAAQLFTDGTQAVAPSTEILYFDVCQWG